MCLPVTVFSLSDTLNATISGYTTRLITLLNLPLTKGLKVTPSGEMTLDTMCLYVFVHSRQGPL